MVNYLVIEVFPLRTNYYVFPHTHPLVGFLKSAQDGTQDIHPVSEVMFHVWTQPETKLPDDPEIEEIVEAHVSQHGRAYNLSFSLSFFRGQKIGAYVTNSDYKKYHIRSGSRFIGGKTFLIVRNPHNEQVEDVLRDKGIL